MKRAVLLPAIAAALAAMAWVNLHWSETPLDISPIVSARPAGEAAPADATGDGLDPVGATATEVTQSLMRPLFHASRRPFQPPPPQPEPVAEAAPAVVEVEAVPPPPEPAPQFRLAGISLSGSARRALLGPVAGPDMRWYEQGDNIDGWTVASITSETVTLAGYDKTFTVPLYAPAGGGVAP